MRGSSHTLRTCPQLGAYRAQYRCVHEAVVVAVCCSGPGEVHFASGVCVTDAARVLISVCRGSQRAQQTVSVRELRYQRERLAEELERVLYGEQGLGLKLADCNRSWAEVREEAQAGESLRGALRRVRFSLPESLLSVARKHNMPPQAPSRQSGLDMVVELSTGHFVPPSVDIAAVVEGNTEASDVYSVRTARRYHIDSQLALCSCLISCACQEASWDSSTTSHGPAHHHLQRFIDPSGSHSMRQQGNEARAQQSGTSTPLSETLELSVGRSSSSSSR